MSDSSHGGRREGAGRTPNAERFAPQIAGCAERLAEALPDITTQLIALAKGEAKGAEVWVAAGTVTRKGVLYKRGPDGKETDEVWLDSKGRPIVVDVPVYPHLAPETLVLAEVEKFPACIKSIAEVWNRLAGKSAQEAPPDKDGIDIREALRKAQSRRAAYADPDDAPPAEGATADG